MAHAQKPDFRLSANRTSPFKSAGGASVQSTAGSRVVRTSGSNVGYMMFRGSVRGTWLPTPFASLPFNYPPVRHRVPTHFNWSLPRMLHSSAPDDGHMVVRNMLSNY